MIAGILLGIVSGLLANELCEFSPWCARKLVRWSALRRYIDPGRAEMRAEELTGLIDDRPGNLFKLTTAVGFAAAAVIVAGRRALTREPDDGIGSNSALPAISHTEAVETVPGPSAQRVITGMRLADVGAVAALEKSVFGAEAWSPELLAAEVDGDPAHRYYLVAEDNGVIIGYGGLLAQRGGQADVLTLAVAADRWGEGTGGALLDGLLSEAARRGCREIFLESRVNNDRAQRLYRGRGFTGIGIRRAYYQPSGADALVMRLVTAPPSARPGLERSGDRS